MTVALFRRLQTRRAGPGGLLFFLVRALNPGRLLFYGYFGVIEAHGGETPPSEEHGSQHRVLVSAFPGFSKHKYQNSNYIP